MNASLIIGNSGIGLMTVTNGGFVLANQISLGANTSSAGC